MRCARLLERARNNCARLRILFSGSFSPYYFDLFAPAFVEGQEGPVDAGGEVAEDGFGGGVDAEGGGGEVEAGWVGGEACGWEVAVALELVEAEGGAGGGVGGLEVVVADADPVVEALEGEVEVFFGLELDDGEAAVGGDGEEVEHAAVGGGEGGDLGVDVGGVEVGIDGLDVAAEEGFEPALGLGAVEGVAFVSGGGAAAEEARDEFAEVGGVVVGERGFVGSGAEGDFERVVEGVAREAGSDTGELQAVEEEG